MRFKVFLTAFLLISISPLLLAGVEAQTASAIAPIHWTISLVVALIAGIWEVVGRLIPSVGQITIIGKIIEILSWLSNFLNKSKK